SAQRRFEVAASMQALAASGDLQTLEQQVETLCRARVATRCCIERSAGEREPHDEDRGHTRFASCDGTQLPLGLRVEIVLQVCARVLALEQFQTMRELP